MSNRNIWRCISIIQISDPFLSDSGPLHNGVQYQSKPLRGINLFLTRTSFELNSRTTNLLRFRFAFISNQMFYKHSDCDSDLMFWAHPKPMRALVRDSFSKLHFPYFGMHLQTRKRLRLCDCSSPIGMCGGDFQNVVDESQCYFEAL